MSSAPWAARIRPILLDGPPGVGKSTLGRALAERTSRRFIDLDERVALEAGVESVAEVFAREGEASFRARERAALRELWHGGSSSAPAESNAPIVALGGGTLADPALRGEALAASVVVGLTLPREALIERLRACATERPLLCAPSSSTGPADPSTRVDPARLDALLERRRGAYERVHLRLDASRSTEELCAELEQLLHDAPIPVGGFDRPQLVWPTREPASALASALRSLAPSSFAFVTDSTVGRLHAAPLLEELARAGYAPSVSITLPPGEQEKSFEGLQRVLEELARAKLDRSSVVVAMGGGVVSDLAGFAASIYLRGVPWIAVPTTLLAQVDASVGGKTAIDLLGAKNVVGSFHPPRAVIVHSGFVQTEALRAQRSGLSEILKVAAIGDVELFEIFERHPAVLDDPSLLGEVVRRAIEAKRSVVERDPTEQGVRMWLNFGHSFGHALESLGGFERFTHGESVAAGMLVALALGTLAGRTEPGVLERVRTVLQRSGCVPQLRRRDFVDACAFLAADKKRRGASLSLVELAGLGCAHVQPWPLAELEATLPQALDRIEIFPD